MSIHIQRRDKQGKFLKAKVKSKPKSSINKRKVTEVLIPLKADEISPKLKRYIDNRIQHQSDYVLECLHIFLMDLEGAFHRDQLDWGED